jgi:hypothetical protein
MLLDRSMNVGEGSFLNIEVGKRNETSEKSRILDFEFRAQELVNVLSVSRSISDVLETAQMQQICSKGMCFETASNWNLHGV